VITALASVSQIKREGLFAGLIVATGTGAFIWLLAWPAWLLSEVDAVTRWLRWWVVVPAWPIGIASIWMLDPEHGIFTHATSWLVLRVAILWALIVLLPVFTLRWLIGPPRWPRSKE